MRRCKAFSLVPSLPLLFSSLLSGRSAFRTHFPFETGNTNLCLFFGTGIMDRTLSSRRLRSRRVIEGSPTRLKMKRDFQKLSQKKATENSEIPYRPLVRPSSRLKLFTVRVMYDKVCLLQNFTDVRMIYSQSLSVKSLSEVSSRKLARLSHNVSCTVLHIEHKK